MAADARLRLNRGLEGAIVWAFQRRWPTDLGVGVADIVPAETWIGLSTGSSRNGEQDCKGET
jgi:hypothetical protein